jgi:hypothetical protein
MKRSRFNEAQIIGILKEQEAGMQTVEVCRRHGGSPVTFYKQIFLIIGDLFFDLGIWRAKRILG